MVGGAQDVAKLSALIMSKIKLTKSVFQLRANFQKCIYLREKNSVELAAKHGMKLDFTTASNRPNRS